MSQGPSSSSSLCDFGVTSSVRKMTRKAMEIYREKTELWMTMLSVIGYGLYLEYCMPFLCVSRKMIRCDASVVDEGRSYPPLA
jgi:hypothetical protein